MQIYGQPFEATDGVGEVFDGVGRSIQEAGVYDFRNLPLAGAIEIYVNVTGSRYRHNAIK